MQCPGDHIGRKLIAKFTTSKWKFLIKRLPKSFTSPSEDPQKTKLFIPNTHRNSDQVRIGLVDVAAVGDHIRNSDAVD